MSNSLVLTRCELHAILHDGTFDRWNSIIAFLACSFQGDEEIVPPSRVGYRLTASTVRWGGLFPALLAARLGSTAPALIQTYLNRTVGSLLCRVSRAENFLKPAYLVKCMFLVFNEHMDGQSGSNTKRDRKRKADEVEMTLKDQNLALLTCRRYSNRSQQWR